LRTRRWTWDAVRRVHSSSGYAIVELKGWDMLVFPNRLWATPEERESFVAEVEARSRAGDPHRAMPPTREADARLRLIEPVLLARIALAAAAAHLILEAQLPFPAGPDRSAAFAGAGLALLGAAIMWWVSGKAFERLAARSAAAALRTAWALFLLLAAAFNLWFFGQLWRG
jgi:hypothetical protein